MIRSYQRGDTTVAAILNAYDIYMLPFVNPDGFVFSQTKD